MIKKYILILILLLTINLETCKVVSTEKFMPTPTSTFIIPYYNQTAYISPAKTDKPDKKATVEKTSKP